MGDSRESQDNFAFAFNDFDFSDRILRLEVTPDDDFDRGGGEDDPTAPRKRIRVEKYNNCFSCIEKDSNSSDGAKVKTLHISSPILAAKSPFFYKLFKNGMRESQHKNDVSLKINASEEATLMDLIRFMYGETDLNATSSPDFMDLLIVADKFEVFSCMSHCVRQLLKLKMSLKSALSYLELPSSVLVSEFVKPLIDAAKRFVAATYKDFTKSQENLMQLPVSAIEAVLGSKGLQVVSEDVVFDFVLKWARASYPDPEERRGILTNRLAPLICFRNMSVTKLKEVLDSADFDHEHVSKLVIEVLISKVQLGCGQQLIHTSDSEDLSTIECGSAGRVYNPHCVVFYNLKKSECANLFIQSIQIISPHFLLGGKLIYLSARRCRDTGCFGLFVNKASSSDTCILDFEFAVMKKSSGQFETKFKVNNHTLENIGWGESNLLGLSRTEFVRGDFDYFINNVLRLRVELTLKNFKP